MEGEVLFETRWKNSRGDTDGWEFKLVGNSVHFSYLALFDAREDEYSHCYATVPLEDFRTLVATFLKDGRATWDGPPPLMQISFYRNSRGTPRITVHSGGYGVSDSMPEIPKSALALLGITHT